jgi:hypothetical protein
MLSGLCEIKKADTPKDVSLLALDAMNLTAERRR